MNLPNSIISNCGMCVSKFMFEIMVNLMKLEWHLWLLKLESITFVKITLA